MRPLAVAVVLVMALAGAAFAQDPLLSQQWHLRDRATEPAGANVLDAWSTTKGLGVVIGIVDDGVQGTHPDLSPNINLSLSLPAGSAAPVQLIPCNPALLGAVLGDGCRGTAIAGVAAARDNAIGVSGVAPRASIASLRLLAPTAPDFFAQPNADALLAAALAFRNDAIHIKNFSWGARDDGATLQPLGSTAEATLEDAVPAGRNGRGTVIVRAAGDGGPFDNCNFDGFANHRLVLAVGAVGDDALPAPYSEACSALFVVAPSSGGTRSITTTDLLGNPGYDPAAADYTDRFGGTAAAAPIASGVVALMLAARPELTERDVKHILVRTAVQIQPADPSWTTGPFPHSEVFGFGLVDASAAVAAARSWTLVDPEQTFDAGPTVVDLPIPDGGAPAASAVQVPPATSPLTVEHIEVFVDIQHAQRGDLEITLVSPAGTESHLATLRPDDVGADLTNWRFGTVRHWGEEAQGTWTLRVADRVGNGQAGTFNSWTMRIYGTAGAPDLTASGHVRSPSGAPVAGVTLTFARDGGGAVPAPVQSDASGAWSQSGFVSAPGASYTVTPSRSSLTFTPAALTFDTDRNDLDFVGTPGCGATPIAPGQTLSGTLATTDCRSTQRPDSFADRFTFAGTAGQQVAVSLTSTTLDPFLFLLRANASTVVAFNDDSGIGLNSRIPATSGFITLPATDTYTIEATSFAPGAVGAYMVSLTTGTGFGVFGNVSVAGGGPLVGVTLTFTRSGGTAPATVQTDSAGAWTQTGFTPGVTYTVTPSRAGFAFSPPSRTFTGPATDLSFVGTSAACNPAPITPGQTLSGTLTAGDCLSPLRPGAFADRYSFTGGAAQQIAIGVTSATLDTYVYLLQTGAPLPIAENDDSGLTLGSRIPVNSGFFTLPADGGYTIEVTTFGGGATGNYTLSLASAASTGLRAAGRVTTPVPGGGTAGLAGVTIGFSRSGTTGALPAAVITDATGAWSQSGFTKSGEIYTATPRRTNYTFEPPSLQFGNNSAGLNFVATAQPCVRAPIAVGQTANGTLTATDCVSTQRAGAFADQYTLTVATPVAIALGSTAFDTYLYVLSGATVVASNDDSGGTTNSRIPAGRGFVTLPAGTYVIEVTSYLPGAIGAYTLSVTAPTPFAASGRVLSGGVARPGVTVAFTRLTGTGDTPPPVLTLSDGTWTQTGFGSDSIYRVTPSLLGLTFSPASRDFDSTASSLDFTGCATTPIVLNQTPPPTGMLAATDCRAGRRAESFADRYTFTVPAGPGQQVAIAMTSTAFDTYLFLERADGTPVAENDDSNGTRNSRIPFNRGVLLLAPGTYVIQASSFNPATLGAYTLSLTGPPVGSFIAAGRVTANGGPLPGVTIGFSGSPAVPSVTTDATGAWSQTLSGSYTVTPSRTGFDFTPPSTSVSGPTSSVNFLGAPSANCPFTTMASVNQTLTGTLDTSDCRADNRLGSFADRYRFSLPATTQVAISLTSSVFDTYLYLVNRTNPGSPVVVTEDDDGGDGTNSRIPSSFGFVNLSAGDYEIQVTSFGNNATGAYTLAVSSPGVGVFAASGLVTNTAGIALGGVTMTFARVGGGTAPAAVTTDADGTWLQTGFASSGNFSVTPSRAGFGFAPTRRFFTGGDSNLNVLDFTATCPRTPIAIGQTLSGSLSATDCRALYDDTVTADQYVFMASAGTPLAMTATSTAFDTVLVLYGPDGSVVAFNDDFAGTNSRIPDDGDFFPLPDSGQYVLEVSSFTAGLTGGYTVSLTAAPGGFAVTGFVGDSEAFGFENALVTFSRVRGTGAVPAAVRTDADGLWTQTGFAFGTIYRATPSVTGFVGSPSSRVFAAPADDLDILMLPAGSATTCRTNPPTLVPGTPVTAFLDATDCRELFFSDFLLDRYVFNAVAGANVTISLSSPDFDTFLVLLGPDGQFVDVSDDFDGESNSQIPETGGFLTLALTGQYVVEVRSARFPAPDHSVYTLTLTTAPSSPTKAPAPARPASGAEITAQFWTPVGEGAASGGGISGDDTAGAGPPSMAVDPVTGDIYVAWESGTSEIFVTRWNGAAWVDVGFSSSAGVGISNTSGQSRFPSIIVKQATLNQPGRPVVAWIDDTSGHWEIYIREFDGNTWVPAGTETAASGGGISNAAGAIVTPEAGRPSLVAERANLFVAWATDSQASNAHRVVVSSLRPFMGWAPLAPSSLNANVAVPAQEYASGYQGARTGAVGIFSDGNPIAVYVTGRDAAGTDFADIHVRRWTPITWGAFPAGAATDAGIADAAPPGSSQMAPRLAMGPDGAPHAAWVIDGGGGNRRILVRRYSSAGNQWRPLGPEAGTGDIFVGDGGIAALSLAIGRDNLPVVAWSDGGSEIFVRKFSSTAGWHEIGVGSATGAGISDTAGLSRFPVIAVDTHQNLNVPIVAWLDNSNEGVSQVYVRRAVSNADLVVDRMVVTPPAAGASAGQPVDLAIVVRNRGAVAAVPFSLGVFLSTDSTLDPGTDRLLTMQQVAALPPTQAAAINLRLTLPADVTPGRYFIGAVADVTNTNGELDEANNTLVSSGFDIGGPDLVVTDVNGPFTATPGQPIRVAVTVKNQALPPGAAAASRAALYLSMSPVAGSGLRVGTAQIGALAPGTSQTVTVDVNVPASFVPGTYFIAAVADEDQRVAETDEDNNGFNSERTIDVVGPDLVVTRVLAPAVSAPRGRFMVTADVKNQATAPAAPSVNVGKAAPQQPVVAGTSPRFRLSFFLTTNGVVQPDSMLLGSRDVERLAPGTTSSTQTSLMLPGNVSSGSYFIVTVADGLGVVQEQDETNNMRAASNAMQVIVPDLTITALRGPALGAAGQPLAVSVTVKNLAQAPANPPAFRIGLYLSTDPEPGSGRLIGFVPVPKLPGGSPAVMLSATPTVPGDLLDNDYFLSAVADVDGVVAESDETNNGFTAPAMVTIARPDLIVTNLSGAAIGAAGQPLAVSVGVKNQGMPPANARPFRVGFFVSAVSTVPGAGTLVGNVSVNGLNAGATLTVTPTITLPGSLAVGTYFLSAVVDDDSRVPESDETNNGFTAPAMVAVRLPDLVMTAVGAPASAGAGQPLPVTLEVKNLGPAPANAGAFRIGVFMVAAAAPDAETAGAGTQIGNVSVPGVAAGATVRLQTTVPVPGGLVGGAYRVSAVADPELRIGDSDRSNNGRVAATPVTLARPDLMITSLTGTTPAASGQRLTVTAMVKNGAPVPADAGPFRVGFFLAPGSDTENKVLIGATAVPALRAGQQAALSGIALTVPANVSAGTYLLSAVADLDGVIGEDNELDNGFTGNTIVVRRPDLTVSLVTAPTVWSTGQAFAVSARVRNEGQAPAAAGAFRVGAYLSTESDPGSGILIGSVALTSLMPQTNASVTIPATIPTFVAPGSYFVSAVADYEGKVAESDTSNNGLTATTPVQIRRADLRVTALTPPPAGVAGRTISVANTVSNMGTAPATAVRVSFFVSPVSATSGQGRVIGTRDVASLGAMGSPTAISTASTTLTLPANLDPGSYFVSAVVDVAGTIVEGDEGNNGFTAPNQILVSPATATAVAR